MKIENHVLAVLQLYEFSMATGKSTNYKECCDIFLRLVLKRKNLSAAWIIEKSDETVLSTYAIPNGESIRKKSTIRINKFLDEIPQATTSQNYSLLSQLSPIEITEGTCYIYNLQKQGFLFFYSKKELLNHVDFIQLKPVIDKFSLSLKVAKVYQNQKVLMLDLINKNKELNDYTHMVSHDLKSDLQSVEALSNWIIEDHAAALDDSGKEKIGLIKNNIEKMDALVKSILEYANIGKINKEFYDIDMNVFLNELLECYQDDSTISIVVKPKLPIIKGELYSLKKLFLSLIENSIKFNNKEKKEIEIGYENKDAFWEFYVKDNGIGIEEPYFKKIFNAFQKLHNDYKSVGIGLSIVKKIIEMYQGTIWMKSKLNQGSVFYFTLKKQLWKNQT